MMRGLLYLLLCVALSSCLKQPAGIEPPPEEGTPPGLDGLAGTDNPPLVIEDSCMLNPGDCFSPEPEPTPTNNAGSNTDDTATNDNTDNTHTGGGSLIVETPAFGDSTALSSIVLTALCDNCLYPVGNDATELQCEISQGCSDGFAFVTRTTALRHEHQQVLCSRGGASKVRDLVGVQLKCTFTQKKRRWFDHKSSDELTLSKAIVTAQHLCVVTEEIVHVSPDNPFPEVGIVTKSCNDSSLSGKKHKLALTFSW